MIASKHPDMVKHDEAVEQRGKVAGYRDMLLMRLDEAEVRLDDAARAHIEACSDGDVLRRWFKRVGEARTIRDVFGDA
ncbi:hypothetical protein [Haliangium sp.]|uniref:hypothetical protein n=1 Tax=Haliangium sp. TaxID=2663208 RepID=UPI003D0EF452